MSKQIIVSFNRVGANGGNSAALYLADMAAEVDDNIGAGRSVGMLSRSPWSACHAIVEDGDTSQTAAAALAQGVFNQGIVGPFAASEIDAAGDITELTAPTPS